MESEGGESMLGNGLLLRSRNMTGYGEYY